MRVVVPSPDATDFSECEESGGLYQTLVCMGEWIIWGDDTGLDSQEARCNFGQRV